MDEMREKQEGIIDWFYGVITRPVETLGEVAQARPVGWAFAVYLGTSLLGYFGSNTTYIPGELGEGFLFFSMIVGLVISLAGIFVITGVVHLLSRLFNSGGGYWNLFSALGFAQFPALFLTPVGLISRLGGSAGAALGGLFSLGIWVWILVLNVIALRESHKLTTGQSILTYVLAIVLLSLIIIVPVVVIVILVARMIT